MLNKQQLVWRCRRGVRELDVLLTRYLDLKYPQLDAQQCEAFERFLEQQDPVIMDWLFGKSSTDDVQLQKIVQQLQEISGINR